MPCKSNKYREPKRLYDKLRREADELATPPEHREAPEAERTMPVGPFLDSLNHDDDCDCEWCDHDRADEASEQEESDLEIRATCRKLGLRPGPMP